MRTNSNNLTRSEKMLIFLYEFGNNGKAKIRYEDIVVGLFKKYPHDFHLKGYTEYPDSGDLIHKPLYNFKKRGYMNATNKIFSLTDRGSELAEQLLGKKVASIENSKDRLSRSAEIEVSRVKTSEGFILFMGGKQNSLSDNDFYSYLGVTVKTQKNAFIGRLETMNAVMNELRRHNNNGLYASLVRYHEFLVSSNKNIIDFFIKD